MSDIPGARNTAGQSATAKQSTGYSSPLGQTVGQGEDSTSIRASEPTPSGALGRDVTENPTRALDKHLSAGAALLRLMDQHASDRLLSCPAWKSRFGTICSRNICLKRDS